MKIKLGTTDYTNCVHWSMKKQGSTLCSGSTVTVVSLSRPSNSAEFTLLALFLPPLFLRRDKAVAESASPGRPDAVLMPGHAALLISPTLVLPVLQSFGAAMPRLCSG